jgi:hypothetical protein
MFPSSTFGLWRWLDEWQTSHPGTGLEWARWAQTHSASPHIFHIYAARLLVATGDREGAKNELLAAAASAHWSTRPSIEAMLQELQSLPP